MGCVEMDLQDHLEHKLMVHQGKLTGLKWPRTDLKWLEKDYHDHDDM